MGAVLRSAGFSGEIYGALRGVIGSVIVGVLLSTSFGIAVVEAELTGLGAGWGGSLHTCALTTGGGVKCWGDNGNGQLGDGSTTQRTTAVDVFGLTSGVSSGWGGGGHTCAVTSAGGVKCWGSNFFGELGDGSTTPRTTVVDVSGLMSGVSSGWGGPWHSCALTTAGGVKCWGDNGNGQLGDGSTTQRTTPTDVTGLTSGVQAGWAGGSHTCVLTSAGGVKCWGKNSFGQIGDGSTTQRTTPTYVTGLTTGVEAGWAGDNHTCVLTTAGGVKCWGNNANGQLGDGSTTDRTTAVDVSGLTSGVSFGWAGDNHTCVLTTAGGVKCWGRNTSGQLGDGSTTDRTTAVDVSGLTSGVSFGWAGNSHTCAVTTAGGVECWGYNIFGQLGDGSKMNRMTAVDVSGLTSGVSFGWAGNSHTCAVTTAGGVECWGRNDFGQLGDGSTKQRTTAVAVSGLTSGVSSGWGGVGHTCAVTSAGGVKCWGNNGNGQLGDGSTTQRTTAVDVLGLTSGVVSGWAGGFYTCALTTSGGVKCWGSNGDGQLGDGSTINRTTAVDVLGLTSGVVSGWAGGSHTCALTTSGGVKCWGDNLFGQLGDGSTTDRTTSVDVSGLTSGVSSVWAGYSHTCALTTAGGVKCWGLNTYGQLGDSSTTQRTTAVAVSGLASGVSSGWGAIITPARSRLPEGSNAGGITETVNWVTAARRIGRRR